MSSDEVVQFYGGAPDSNGRTLDQILAWDDEQLEDVHDYIQWVFPTRQPSGVNLAAPLVTAATVRSFTGDEKLRATLRRAIARMLRFYGLHWTGNRVDIDATRFAERARVWLHPGNHNHLRLTRIMDSLSTLCLRNEAQALQRCLLEDICLGAGTGRVTQRTIEFWSRAVNA